MKLTPKVLLAALLLVSIALVVRAEEKKKERVSPFIISKSYGSPKAGIDRSNWEPKRKFKVDGLTTHEETYAGHISPRASGKSQLFYLLHSKYDAKLTDPAPLIVWFQGGPGCSSLFGNFGELGPIEIEFFDGNETHYEVKYKDRPYSWTKKYHLLFIDQPIGVGYSIYDKLDDPVKWTTQAADDVHAFFIEFFKEYPELQKNPVYFFGESYAGHYVPAFAYTVWQKRAENKINLAGMGIGDGLVDPINQLTWYDSYSFSNGLIGTDGRLKIAKFQSEAVLNILQGAFDAAAEGLDKSLEVIMTTNDGINVYNYRQYGADLDGYIPAWADHKKTKNLFNIPEDMKYYGCNMDINRNFSNDIARSFAGNVRDLAGNIKIIIFQGQDDIIINTPGQNHWISMLDFPKSDDIRTMPKKIWKVNGKVAGNFQNKGKFYYVVVNKAGHMVPMDQPSAAWEMLNHFMNDDQDWN